MKNRWSKEINSIHTPYAKNRSYKLIYNIKIVMSVYKSQNQC